MANRYRDNERLFVVVEGDAAQFQPYQNLFGCRLVVGSDDH